MKSIHVILLKTAFVVIAVATTIVACFWLYTAAFEGQKDWLDGMVQSQARIIDALREFEEVAVEEEDEDQNPFEETLRKLAEANVHFREFGETGEFLIGFPDKIGFRIISAGQGGLVEVPGLFRFNDYDRAEPMRLALKGEWGIVVGNDYRGVRVLAAYKSLKNGLGVVAKVNLDEIRTPYMWAGMVFSGLSIVLILGGSLVLLRVTLPAYSQMKRTRQRLEMALEASGIGTWTWDLEKNRMSLDERSSRIVGISNDKLQSWDSVFSNCLHPDDARRVESEFHESIEKGSSFVTKFRITPPEEIVRHVFAIGRVFQDPEGGPDGMTGVILDRSEYKNRH